jgi:hypothetical protein
LKEEGPALDRDGVLSPKTQERLEAVTVLVDGRILASSLGRIEVVVSSESHAQLKIVGRNSVRSPDLDLSSITVMIGDVAFIQPTEGCPPFFSKGLKVLHLPRIGIILDSNFMKAPPTQRNALSRQCSARHGEE